MSVLFLRHSKASTERKIFWQKARRKKSSNHDYMWKSFLSLSCCEYSLSWVWRAKFIDSKWNKIICFYVVVVAFSTLRSKYNWQWANNILRRILLEHFFNCRPPWLKIRKYGFNIFYKKTVLCILSELFYIKSVIFARKM